MKFAQIVPTIVDETQEMRSAFCNTLIELAEQNQDLVLLDADLMSAMGTIPFQKRFPDRTFDCGIQEANMVGVAAGLSVSGKIPFVHTFGPFMSRRACDQIFVSLAFAQLNAKLIGSDPGITAQINGGTHMPFEDMGIMRSIPHITVIEPTDVTMLKCVVRQMSTTYGVQYMRLVRKSSKKIYQDGETFKIGEAVLLRKGSDVTLIASGYCVSQALAAADILHRRGISARVIDMFTWKPVDVEAIVESARQTGAIVTCENHNVTTGLGAAVSEVVVRHCPVAMEFIGVNDEFGQVGNLDFLAETYHLTAGDIAEAAQKAIARKGNP